MSALLTKKNNQTCTANRVRLSVYILFNKVRAHIRLYIKRNKSGRVAKIFVENNYSTGNGGKINTELSKKCGSKPALPI